MKKKKIALNLLYVIPGKVGGTQTYAEGILQGLSLDQSELEIHVICSQEYYKKVLKNKQYQFKYHLIPLVEKSRVLRILFENLLLPFLSYKNQFDVVHSLGYTSPLFLPSKNIVTIHDLNWYYQAEDFSFINRIIWQVLVTLSAKFSDLIITDSLASKKSLVKVLKVKAKKIKVVYPGVSLYQVSKKKLKNLKKQYLLTVTSLLPHKNVKKLLEAFKIVTKKLPQLQLVIVGLAGKDSNLIKDFIKNNFKDNQVLVTGWVSNQELAYLYRNAKAFVFVSLYEGFGFPILEAFGYNVPVVSSLSYSLKEIAGEATQVVDPTSSSDIAKQIIKVVSKPKLVNNLLKKAKLQLQKFSWEKTVKQLKNIYQRV